MMGPAVRSQGLDADPGWRASGAGALRAFALAGVLVAFFVPAPLGAQSRNASVDRFTPALDSDGFITVQGTRTPGSGNRVLSLISDYARRPLSARLDDGSNRDPIADRVESQFGFEVGVGGRAALGMRWPVIAYQHGDLLPEQEWKLQPFALADPELLARLRVLGESANDQTDRRDGPGLALQLGGSLPIGDEDAYAGEGSSVLSAELLADLHVLAAGLGASVGVRHRFVERELAGGRRLGDEMTFGAGVKLPVPPLRPLLFLAEVGGAADFKHTTVLEVRAGVRADYEELSLLCNAGAGLTSAVGSPGLRIALGLYYQPRDADRDGDGVPDERDECPPLAEDLDGFEDGDGCPDPDNDNDLIPDADDLCPNEEALEDQDLDEDGCTDAPKPR
ncbi:MAG: hypothetical protein OEZ06_08955 [Myxococcales bacterium]|nr:hypothetical protein [Myxococcales bacterium]